MKYFGLLCMLVFISFDSKCQQPSIDRINFVNEVFTRDTYLISIKTKKSVNDTPQILVITCEYLLHFIMNSRKWNQERATLELKKCLLKNQPLIVDVKQMYWNMYLLPIDQCAMDSNKSVDSLKQEFKLLPKGAQTYENKYLGCVISRLLFDNVLVFDGEEGIQLARPLKDRVKSEQ